MAQVLIAQVAAPVSVSISTILSPSTSDMSILSPSSQLSSSATSSAIFSSNLISDNSSSGSSSNQHNPQSSVSSSASSVSNTATNKHAIYPVYGHGQNRHKPASTSAPLNPVRPNNSSHQKSNSTRPSSSQAQRTPVLIRPYAFQSTPDLLPSSQPLTSSSLTFKNESRDDSSISLSTQSPPFSQPQMPVRPTSAFIVASLNQPVATPSFLNNSDLTSSAQKPQPSRYHRPQSRMSSSATDLKFASGHHTRTVSDVANYTHTRSDSSSSVNTILTSVSATTPRSRLSEDFSSKIEANSLSNQSKRYRRRSVANTSSLSLVSAREDSSPITYDRPTIVMVGSDTAAHDDDYADATVAAALGDAAIDPLFRASSSHTRISSNEDSVSGSIRPTTSDARSPSSPHTPSHPPEIPTPSTNTEAATDETKTLNPTQPTPVSSAPLFKGVRSRLRRALSFGSATELQQMSQNQSAAHLSRTSVSRKSLYSEDRIINVDGTLIEDDAVGKQEAAGLGNNIYSSRSGFSHSTDNVSVSSTASSASMVLRKMSRGMKRSTRSLRSLFRPKTLINSNTGESIDGEVAAGATPLSGAPSVGVSTESVRAVRPIYSRSGGNNSSNKAPPKATTAISALSRELASGTLSRTADVPNRPVPDGDRPSGSSSSTSSAPAGVKRGILKHTMSVPSMNSASLGSFYPTPTVGEISKLSLAANHRSVRPKLGLRRPNDFALGGGYQHSNRSMPGQLRNISFNTQVQFYDVWSSNDYDRRGEVATCNRLTPDLAQQIKEELNLLKMEMEVHELSRPYTQFF